MNQLPTFIGLAAASLLAFSASPASAGQFTGSYDFGGPATNGDIFRFEFDGTVNGNLIENVSNLGNFSLGGAPIFEPDNPGFVVVPTPSSTENTLSFDGVGSNFLALVNLNPSDFRGFGFSFGSGEAKLSFSENTGGFLVESFDPNQFSVIDTTTAIPSPALLPGLIGMGFAAIRKRNLAQSDEA
ncbi:PTPA-CTERM sorting domain-containing protein [Leptothoe sp. PORK10 BA2]|uniref:PTPA-CTERM sorting domain-containing protein n=1 Tax=Leptothoe sp. PORK10 BA2 TaxID=3110254 RepID=UPI002B21C0C0|nr:PTPA-CTERM sorting domain-containing protein [Leptothoe sp. PORK10 BA2]MEA5462100.1 PTPA-CTERM sorting domain-containing protein [Leptothoe sp. PORK10 BA2]